MLTSIREIERAIGLREGAVVSGIKRRALRELGQGVVPGRWVEVLTAAGSCE